MIWYEPKTLTWGLKEVIGNTQNQLVLGSIEDILDHLKQHTQTGDAIIIMSNGGFENIHQRLLQALG